VKQPKPEHHINLENPKLLKIEFSIEKEKVSER